MNTLKFTNSFKSILKDWESLYTVTPEVSPFLHPDAMKIAVRYFYPYYLAWKCRPIFAIYTEDNKPKVIIPLLKFLNGSYKLFGDVNGFDECGCVYTDIQSLNESSALLKAGIGSFELARIDERSPLATFAPENCKKTANVAISFGDSFDEYFKSLSSSVRQNVRTAYNRLSKDGYAFDCKTFIGVGNHLPVTEIIDLYCNRHQGRYGVSTSSLKRWFLKHQNFATRFYRYSPNALSFYLTIDGRPAAFLSGLFTKERLIVPRLSINNGVDISTYAQAAPSPELETIAPGSKKIIMVAGFRWEKDQPTLIKALKSLPEDFHLFLVGDGDRHCELEALVADINLQSRVHFLGLRSDVPQLLHAADYVVMSSHFEGLSLSSVEGMSVGKPFLASNVDGLREVVSGAGILFPHEDAKALAQEVMRLDASAEEYRAVADACGLRACQFDISQMADGYEKIYLSISNNKI